MKHATIWGVATPARWRREVPRWNFAGNRRACGDESVFRNLAHYVEKNFKLLAGVVSLVIS